TNRHQHVEKGSFTERTFSFLLTSVKSHEQTSYDRKGSLAVEAALKPSVELVAGKMLVPMTQYFNRQTDTEMYKCPHVSQTQSSIYRLHLAVFS
ncbi:hypothetical protein LSAT2_018452, partial [Lamellibrachia satsuma]